MKESNFQFTEPSLKTIEFEENEEFNSDEGKRIAIQSNLKVNNSMITDNEAMVELQLILGERSSKVPFYMKTIFVAKFKWDSNLQEKNVEIFLNQNAPALLLSYARPIVSMVTNASHYPAYNIPFINFADKNN